MDSTLKGLHFAFCLPNKQADVFIKYRKPMIIRNLQPQEKDRYLKWKCWENIFEWTNSILFIANSSRRFI